MQIRLDFFDLLLFAVMVSFFVIGIHQSIYHGVAASYWLFMFSMLAFLWLNKRLKEKKAEKGQEKAPEGKKKSGKRK
jgi:peptidoglycan/LPS O-acetylase OafA/YrhL